MAKNLVYACSSGYTLLRGLVSVVKLSWNATFWPSLDHLGGFVAQFGFSKHLCCGSCPYLLCLYYSNSFR